MRRALVIELDLIGSAKKIPEEVVSAIFAEISIVVALLCTSWGRAFSLLHSRVWNLFSGFALGPRDGSQEMEPRIARLATALDSGNLTKALRISNENLLRIQRQSPHSPSGGHDVEQLVFKVLKGLVLARSGNSSVQTSISIAWVCVDAASYKCPSDVIVNRGLGPPLVGSLHKLHVPMC